jgi:hypothetical protein
MISLFVAAILSNLKNLHHFSHDMCQLSFAHRGWAKRGVGVVPASELSSL